MKITSDMAGCWIEGSRGQYATSYLVEIALSYPGYLRASTRSDTTYARTEARQLVRAYNAGKDVCKYRRKPRYGSSYTVTITTVFEHIMDLADEAEEFLNTLAPKGYTFGWFDGEFFLQLDEWWTGIV